MYSFVDVFVHATYVGVVRRIVKRPIFVQFKLGHTVKESKQHKKKKMQIQIKTSSLYIRAIKIVICVSI